MLGEGRWDGRQVVPGAWLRESVTPRAKVEPSVRYGYFWWLDPPGYQGGFSAAGNLGQFIYVLPVKDLVIVRFGERNGQIDWFNLFQTIARHL